MPPRFVPLADVAETLSISASQAYALVRSGELRAIKVGGRGQWRVEQVTTSGVRLTWLPGQLPQNIVFRPAP